MQNIIFDSDAMIYWTKINIGLYILCSIKQNDSELWNLLQFQTKVFEDVRHEGNIVSSIVMTGENPERCM